MKLFFAIVMTIALGTTLIATTSLAETPFPGKTSNWYGFTMHNFNYDGRPCHLVVPHKVATGTPWIWRARFFGHEPQADIALLQRGYHLVYMDVANLYGAAVAVNHWNQFYTYLTTQHGFAKKATLEGLFVAAGYDAGTIEYRIDGGAWKQQDLFTPWSKWLHIPWAYILSDTLKPARHKLTIRISSKKNAQSRGHACRIAYLLVNKS